MIRTYTYRKLQDQNLEILMGLYRLVAGKVGSSPGSPYDPWPGRVEALLDENESSRINRRSNFDVWREDRTR